MLVCHASRDYVSLRQFTMYDAHDALSRDNVSLRQFTMHDAHDALCGLEICGIVLRQPYKFLRPTLLQNI
jgi:hypothetical protein